jgi:hypothetical protein
VSLFYYLLFYILPTLITDKFVTGNFICDNVFGRFLYPRVLPRVIKKLNPSSLRHQLRQGYVAQEGYDRQAKYSGFLLKYIPSMISARRHAKKYAVDIFFYRYSSRQAGSL